MLFILTLLNVQIECPKIISICANNDSIVSLVDAYNQWVSSQRCYVLGLKIAQHRTYVVSGIHFLNVMVGRKLFFRVQLFASGKVRCFVLTFYYGMYVSFESTALLSFFFCFVCANHNQFQQLLRFQAHAQAFQVCGLPCTSCILPRKLISHGFIAHIV